MNENTYIHPTKSTPPTPDSTVVTSPPDTMKKNQLYIQIGTGVITAVGFLTILMQIIGTINISIAWFYFQLVVLIAAWAMMNRQNEKRGQTLIVALIVAITIMIIINSIWPGATIKSAYESSFMTTEIYLSENTKNETIDVPDKTTVRFKSNKRFLILERRGTKPDGSYIMEPVKMPPGKSERYFTWGGNIVLQGLYDETSLKVSY